MAKTKRRGAPVFRPIHCEMWADDAFSELDTNTKLTFIYLLTNSRTTPCGIYTLSIRQGAYETGLTQKQFEDSISKLVDRVRIGYAYDTNEVYILNWLRYNGSNSPQWLKAVEDSLSFVKSNDLRELYNQRDRACIPYAYGIDVVPNRDRERDRERDTSKGEKYRMPTLSSDVYPYATSIGLTEAQADAWFDYHETREWKKMGKTERSVKASLRTWKHNNGIFPSAPEAPTPNEIGDFCKDKWPDRIDGTNPELSYARDFYRHYEKQGWRLSNGNAITNWRIALVEWVEKSMREATV